MALNMLIVTCWLTPTGLGLTRTLLYVGTWVPAGGMGQKAMVARVEVVSKRVIRIVIVMDILFLIFSFPFLFLVLSFSRVVITFSSTFSRF